MKDDIKVGDIVELITTGQHNSDVFNYRFDIAFSSDELGKHITILDIGTDKYGEHYYEAACAKGITYLRRAAFDLVVDINGKNIREIEDMTYLIPVLERLK